MNASTAPLVFLILFCGTTTTSADILPSGWSVHSPRDEIRPSFLFDPAGGPSKTGTFVITHDSREGLDGWFEREFPIAGADWIRFRVLRKTTNVADPRRSCLVRIRWIDANGRMPSAAVSEDRRRELGHVPSAEPEHPADGPLGSNGWTPVGGVFRVPPKAAKAVVELHLQWSPVGSVEWADVEIASTAAPSSRTVRLATVHYKPSGNSPKANCEEYEPFISQAAARKADLVVLGETVPYVNTKKMPHETAEPVPGPTTEFFGGLAKKHGLHIALSLYERQSHLVYNTAVLLGPDGQLIGKYRKTCLPHAEVERGVSPGSEFPVFDTRFGKVGLMVCYDGFFPEVARELANRGAEVIAWPVWGCDPLLAKARAAENRVHVVSSTFMAPKDEWMLSAVFGPTGKVLAKADAWGTIAVAEVELGRPTMGPWNLGDFHSMFARHRPNSTPQPESKPTSAKAAGGVFIDSGFENASPLWYETTADGVVEVHLLYDHERTGVNRAAGHIHFAVEAKQGGVVVVEFRNIDNVYNGRHGSVAGELKSLVVSEDGVHWRPAATRTSPGSRLQLELQMTSRRMYVARVEPYRLSNLDRWLAEVRRNSLAEVTTIGKTVEGRELEIVRIGDPNAPRHVFVRARAHPWEAGGNWVAQGLADRLLRDDAEAKTFRSRYCLWLLPMANKDGVAKGRTRFNLHGVDLNRGWDHLADPTLAPENHALERWLESQIKAGHRPSLALELHNDGNGRLHFARPSVTGDRSSSARLERFESLLRKHTWFTEGITRPSDPTVFTLADGMLQRFGVDAAVHEFNCQWAAGLSRPPLAKDWLAYGEGLARALHEYFER